MISMVTIKRRSFSIQIRSCIVQYKPLPLYKKNNIHLIYLHICNKTNNFSRTEKSIHLYYIASHLKCDRGCANTHGFSYFQFRVDIIYSIFQWFTFVLRKEQYQNVILKEQCRYSVSILVYDHYQYNCYRCRFDVESRSEENSS